MSIFSLDGSKIATAYDKDGSEIAEGFDLNGDIVFYPQYSMTLLDSQEISTGQSPQGLATYDGHIFQFFSTSNKMKILDQQDYSAEAEMSCTIIGHGNNLQFGNTVQSNGFPFLYASDSESANARSIYVCSADLEQISLSSTISLPNDVGNFPNGVIDFTNGKIYTVGYTASTVYDATGNNVFCILDLSDPSTVIDTWQTAYLGVMNGLVWDGEHIIVNMNTWDGTDVKFYFIDPSTKQIDTTVTFDKEYNSEYQGMAIQDEWLLVSKWIYKTISGSTKLFYEFWRFQL